MRLGPKISQILHVLEDLGMRAVDLLKLFGPMIGHFGLRGFKPKGGIPSAALRAIEPAAGGMRIQGRGPIN